MTMQQDFKNTIKLVDPFGRRIRKLRVSLLDACNFRCFYCMPEDAQFMKSSKWLSVAQIQTICRELTQYGLKHIRVTGGEPTLRKEFDEILMGLSSLDIEKLGMTSNGYHLEKKLAFLKGTKCQNINISLDSLKSNKFSKITKRVGSFEKVYSAILKAKEMGFHVKLNTVLMKGINDNEILDFVEFSEKYQIEVRFLEIMKIGQACGSQDDLFVSAHQAIEKIKEQRGLMAEKVEFDSTSINFKTSENGKIGFIASESKPFCNSCSRWRLSPDGFLRACLMSDKGVDLREVPLNEYGEQLSRLLLMKPYQRIDHVSQDMNQIGG